METGLLQGCAGGTQALGRTKAPSPIPQIASRDAVHQALYQTAEDTGWLNKRVTGVTRRLGLRLFSGNVH